LINIIYIFIEIRRQDETLQESSDAISLGGTTAYGLHGMAGATDGISQYSNLDQRWKQSPNVRRGTKIIIDVAVRTHRPRITGNELVIALSIIVVACFGGQEDAEHEGE
jgi:hypothetical protein